MLKENLDISQRMRIVGLYDLYGSLLTERQKKCMELYFYNDLSLSEVAEELEVTRQAIYDLLRRVEQILERYEKELKLLEHFKETDMLLSEAETRLKFHLNNNGDLKSLNKVLSILTELKSKGRV
ncbi:MAG TPA: DNA-binding protein [Candidatus Avacidaminococcus intestinavium]|uniref:UPF0122 protein IAB06_00530 n=1 Tax=Candidatus Avacidaminococcus intestinavium TaxID=2840684 RepID=A0A9D1SK68_9FIRM|nr:DNA-binding protein [Candidatus Avacidaminococcus intestinavium]